MQAKWVFFLAIVLSCVLQRAQAEAEAGAEERYAIEENAARSFKDAQLVALGKFRPVASKYPFTGFVDVEFQIEKFIVVKKSMLSVLRLSLPLPRLATTKQAVTSQPRQQEIDAALASQKTLETLFEQKRLTRATYKALSQQNSRLLVRSDDYLRKFVLLSVWPRGLDGPGRHADVVLNFGEPVVFMMNIDYSEKYEPQHLMPTHVDFYPASDARIRRLVGLK